jgi:type 1 glutamine amidotransferase
VPVAWVKEYGAGRVYFNNLGHNESSWADERYLKSITEAVRWIRGEIQLDAKPNPELSAQQEQTAKTAAEAVNK